MVKTNKWEERSIGNMNKISHSSITLSFEQMLKIDNHSFGTLNLHRNEKTLSFGGILANDIRCALVVTDPNRFTRGKST